MSCASTANSSPTRVTSSATSFGSAPSRRGQLLAGNCTTARPSPWQAAMPDLSKRGTVPSVRYASSGTRSWIWSDPPATSTTKAASTTPSPTAGITTGRPRTSPACPTRSSTSSPGTPTAPHRRGRTQRCSTWVAQLRGPPGTPPPTLAAMWSTTSSLTQPGSPSRTRPSGHRRPRGPENSRTPCSPTVPAST